MLLAAFAGGSLIWFFPLAACYVPCALMALASKILEPVLVRIAKSATEDQPESSEANPWYLSEGGYMNCIGIDLGTSACKLLLVAEDGSILNTVTKEYPLIFPHPGWSEQKPEDWWSAVVTGVPELLRGFDASEVAGIGSGGQMHGLVALDEADNVIRPAILWNDGRTSKEVDYLNNVVGKDMLSSLTANIAFAGFTAPKLLWMRENEPENFKKIAKIMLPKDYLTYKLTGVHACDYQNFKKLYPALKDFFAATV